MMHSKKLLILLLPLLLSCGKSSEKKSPNTQNDWTYGLGNEPVQPTPEKKEEQYVSEFTTWDTAAYEELRKKLPPFDFEQDLSTKTLEELRILRNTVPARHGYLFMNADLRYYFYNTPWYKGLMEARWYGDCEYSGLQPAPPISYSPEETAFMEKVRKLEDERRLQNYITKDGLKHANVKNIVNGWQFGQFPEELLTALEKNGFVIVPNQNVQLFHLYEQNDYSQTQNFVTTDLFLQLFHMHFSFMLRGLEENKFVPVLGELLNGFQAESKKVDSKLTPGPAKNAVNFNAAFYSIPLSILGEKNVPVPQEYQKQVSFELKNIENGSATFSPLLPAYKEIYFPYDLFKPRGHYTRTDTLKRYFKAMQWLQTAPYCFNEETDLTRAVTAAFILNTGKGKSGKPLKDLYAAILEPTSFLIGAPDNVSLLDLCHIIDNKWVLTDLITPESLAAIKSKLNNIQAQKNVIKPKIENTCSSKLNFMPARFVLDNEIIQAMADPENRPYPQGLDVMASFGSKAAEDILMNELQEDKKWKDFLPNLEKMKSKYGNYENWDATVYAKWIEGLMAILKPDAQYPYFMQLPSWNKKNLNTTLASWAELKHDAVLYAEQPYAAECGGGEDCSPPPEPYVPGYVEPNVNYWKQTLELLALTDELLTRHNLLDYHLRHKQNQLRELCTFLLTASEKELRGEKLTEQEHRTIEKIGSHVDYITLSIIGVSDWSFVSGVDREIAVVADIYTNNVGDKAGILHAAVGYGNDIYVVVEIDGYLYLTKGSTFSYYEFPRPLDQRMTDEEWQEMLKGRKVYPPPTWMKDVILDLKKSVQPQVQEYLYSSGC